MSLQWTLIAGVLYAELTLVMLLILPILSPSRWNRILHSNFMKILNTQASWYFYFLILVLILFFLDAVREMRKYSDVESHDNAHSHMDVELQNNMRLFRAQRNFYISGFALFLSFVIRRLLHLMTKQAALIAEREAALKQAASASAAASSLLNKSKDEKDADDVQSEKIESLEKKVKSLEEQLSKSNKDREAMKSQSESLTKEYDRLMEEHRKLQNSVSASGDKKHE